MTKDLVPIIYHDFSLSESGTDVPIHDVSLKQVTKLSSPQIYVWKLTTFLYAGKSVLPEDSFKISRDGRTWKHKSRSRSLTRDGGGSIRHNDRLQHTVDFISKGFKPNHPGTSIQSPFATLEDLLVKLPENLGFVIEMSTFSKLFTIFTRF